MHWLLCPRLRPSIRSELDPGGAARRRPENGSFATHCGFRPAGAQAVPACVHECTCKHGGVTSRGASL
eukprot:6376711-Amphidinium_carterae.1